MDVPVQTEPQFAIGARVFSHYAMQWGEVVEQRNTVRGKRHGVTGSELPDTTWYMVRWDNGSRDLMDDAHGNWEMARIVPPAIAQRFGYGSDPKGATT